MAGTIGGISFVTLRGRPLAAADEVEVHARAGEDGEEVRNLGSRGAEVELTTTATAADADAAQTAAEAQRALIGTVVAITDSHGKDHAGCLVLDARPAVTAVLKPANSPTDTTLITTRWRVKKLPE